MTEKAIGKITATEKAPTSCNELRFWVHKNILIRPFDIIKVDHVGGFEGAAKSQTYAIVQGMEYITDSQSDMANYISSDFGDVDSKPQNERIGTTVVTSEVLYNNQGVEMPVKDGNPVKWADVDGIKEALGLKAMQNPIPAGYIEMSNGTEIPIELESRYLIGPEGAHLNIAGISGLATKTSYAMFLMNSIQQRMPDETTMIIFNVKSTDLLSIDLPRKSLDDSISREWGKCGLDPHPFKNVKYLYPYSNQPGKNFSSSHIPNDILQDQIDEKKALNYYYNVQSLIDNFQYLFSDIDDPNSTIESILSEIRVNEFQSIADLRRFIDERSQKGSTRNSETPVASWRRFKRLLRTRTQNKLFSDGMYTIENTRGTLINEAISKLTKGQICVIDIEPLPDYLQCLVFGDVLNTIYSIKLGESEDVSPEDIGTVIVFADELNKYAPKVEGQRSLTTNLLEITERGRSLGVILFSAEQFRSGVHDRVLGNCSTNVFGRTSPVEIKKCPDYGYFPKFHQSMVTMLPQGSLLLQHAAFKTALIKVRFPHPCYYQPQVR